MSLNNSSRISEKVECFFDNYADDFDSIYGDGQKRSKPKKIIDKLFRQSMFNRYKRTLKFIFQNKKLIQSCLDVGSGPGRYCEDIGSKQIEVLGIDISAKMIDKAKKNTSPELHKYVSYLVGDYSYCNLEKKYDASILMGFFDYIEDPYKIFEKLLLDTNKFILASFPKKYELLSVQRLIRYKFKNCPLYLYSKSNLISILERLSIQRYTILDNGREYFVICEI